MDDGGVSRDGISQETQLSIAASSFFPGFKFSPTDIELISYYLKRKIDGYEKSVEVIPEVEIYKHEPWDLPALSVVNSDSEWFFFCARGRKYPHGSQTKRATTQGYWKATGKERNVKQGSDTIGTKRTLVFHIGRAPKGERTEWIMHEYCMSGNSQETMVVCRLKRNLEFQASTCKQQLHGSNANLTDGNYNLADGNLNLPDGNSTLADGNSNLADGSSSNLADGNSNLADGNLNLPDGNSNLADGNSNLADGNSNLADGDSSNLADGNFNLADGFAWDKTTESNSASDESDVHKQSNEVTESSNPKKASGDEDCYAEILNDDIINLDETSFSTRPQNTLAETYTINPASSMAAPRNRRYNKCDGEASDSSKNDSTTEKGGASSEDGEERTTNYYLGLSDNTNTWKRLGFISLLSFIAVAGTWCGWCEAFVTFKNYYP